MKCPFQGHFAFGDSSSDHQNTTEVLFVVDYDHDTTAYCDYPAIKVATTPRSASEAVSIEGDVYQTYR